DRGCSDRAEFVIEPAFADRDAFRGLEIDHIEADPVGRRQPMQIERDVAVDEAQTLLAGIGKGAGEIPGRCEAGERRERSAYGQVANLAHPEPARSYRPNAADDRPRGPFAVHAEPRVG